MYGMILLSLNREYNQENRFINPRKSYWSFLYLSVLNETNTHNYTALLKD